MKSNFWMVDIPVNSWKGGSVPPKEVSINYRILALVTMFSRYFLWDTHPGGFLGHSIIIFQTYNKIQRSTLAVWTLRLGWKVL